MDQQLSEIVIQIGSFRLELQQSIVVWLVLCVLFMIFFWLAGKAIDRADPAKAPTGIVYFSEEVYNVILYVVQGNLKETTLHYVPIFGTLMMMMLVSNLVGLVGFQNPTSNVSFNATLALMFFFMIQYQAIRKGGLVNRLKELTEPIWFLTPLNIIGDLALPLSMTMRLFGNILAGVIISMLMYTVIKNTAPWGYLGLSLTPFIHAYLDVFSGFIQTYIFFTIGTYFLGQQVSRSED